MKPGFASGRVVKIIVALEFGDDGIFQAGRAADSRVFGETIVNGGNGRILDVLRGIEIRFSCAQSDDVLAFGLEPGSPRSNGESRGGFDGLNAFREFHDNILVRHAGKLPA